MKKKYYFVALLLLGVAACAGIFTQIYRAGQKPSDEKGILAAASFYPVYVAAANVIGNCSGIRLENLSEPQTGCLHDFQLTTEDMKLLSKADIFLANGGGMESFLTDTARQYPNLAIVETADRMALSEGNAHVWMSVKCYRRQVAAIAKALCDMAPEYREELEANTAAYDAKLADLERQQEEIKQASSGSKAISFHDAFAYLAEDCGFEIGYSINLDEERQIGSAEAANVIGAIQKDGIRVILAEELYGSGFAETIKKEADVMVYYLDTLSRGEYEPDSYINGMQENIRILKKAFGV